LEDFLEDFRGCVVVVSHDRYFLDRTVDRLFAFENGALQRFEGNYSAYLDRQQDAGKGEARQGEPRQGPPAAPADRAAGQATGPAPAAAKAAAGEAAAKPRRRSFKESRELQALETELPRWEARRSELEGLLTRGGRDYTALEALTQELAGLSERILAGEERWLELSELVG
ncbi:MAG: ABC transporter ATP-binding protein, partial [Cyanobacteriota bacterium]